MHISKIQAVPLARIHAILSKIDMDLSEVLAEIEADAVPMVRDGIEIVGGIEGGVFQGASYRIMEGQAGNVSLLVADYDTNGADPSELSHFSSGEFESEAVVQDVSLALDEAFVKGVSDAYDETHASASEMEVG